METKGYPVSEGYKGYLPEDSDSDKNGYFFFASEADYNDQLEENKGEN